MKKMHRRLGRAYHAISAILLGIVAQPDAVQAESFDWTYDFGTGNLAADWIFNTNNPATVNFGPAGPGLAAISKTGSTVFHAAAQNDLSYGLGVGDTLSMNLAWSPFATQNSPGNNNQVFQLGVITHDVPGGSDPPSGNTFANGDGFYLAGRELQTSASPPDSDVWGTQKLDLWIHTDEASAANPFIAEYLGQIDINSFRDGSDGSVSTTFLDIDLQLEVLAGGDVEYSVAIDAFEWTLLAGVTTWVPQGSIFSNTGTRAHSLYGLGELHPTIGYIVSDNSQEGAQASYWGDVPATVPEPGAASLLLCAIGFLMVRRRQR